jgi:hypothetical protein
MPGIRGEEDAPSDSRRIGGGRLGQMGYLATGARDGDRRTSSLESDLTMTIEEFRRQLSRAITWN